MKFVDSTSISFFGSYSVCYFPCRVYPCHVCLWTQWRYSSPCPSSRCQRSWNWIHGQQTVQWASGKLTCTTWRFKLRPKCHVSPGQATIITWPESIWCYLKCIQNKDFSLNIISKPSIGFFPLQYSTILEHFQMIMAVTAVASSIGRQTSAASESAQSEVSVSAQASTISKISA